MMVLTQEQLDELAIAARFNRDIQVADACTSYHTDKASAELVDSYAECYVRLGLCDDGHFPPLPDEPDFDFAEDY
jgi:hypothetical protein